MQVPEQVVRALQEVAASHPAVRALWVFGSRVRDDARPDSDLDLGVLFSPPQPLEAVLRLEDALEQAANLRVQLLDAARTGPFVALEIIRGDRIYWMSNSEGPTAFHGPAAMLVGMPDWRSPRGYTDGGCFRSATSSPRARRRMSPSG